MPLKPSPEAIARAARQAQAAKADPVRARGAGRYCQSLRDCQILRPPGGRHAARTIHIGDAEREWCIHLHVPLFLDRLGSFENTQPILSRLLELQVEQTPTAHLEIETYSWDVLPESYRGMTVVDAIAREMQWVIGALTR